MYSCCQKKKKAAAQEHQVRSEADTRCSLDLDEQDELYQVAKRQRSRRAEKTNAPPTQQDSVPLLYNQAQKRYDCGGLLQQKDS